MGLRTHFRPVLQELRVFYGSETENGGIIHGSYSWCRLYQETNVEIGLTYIYGIGRTSADRILKEANVNPDTE